MAVERGFFFYWADDKLPGGRYCNCNSHTKKEEYSHKHHTPWQIRMGLGQDMLFISQTNKGGLFTDRGKDSGGINWAHFTAELESCQGIRSVVATDGRKERTLRNARVCTQSMCARWSAYMLRVTGRRQRKLIKRAEGWRGRDEWVRETYFLTGIRPSGLSCSFSRVYLHWTEHNTLHNT